MLSVLLAHSIADPRLDQILDQQDLQGGLTAAVVLDQQGRTLYERHSRQRLAPASCQKILSCLYVLATFGPEHRFVTRFWKTGEGVIVDAPGDPSITTQKLKDARQALGVTDAQLVLARQGFRVGLPPTWEWDDLAFRYAAPISAFSVDRAAFELWASEGRIEPPAREFGVDVQHRRQTGPVRASFNRWLKTLDVNGSLPQTRTQIGTFALPEPDETAAKLLAGPLKNYDGPFPARLPDYTITSEPLSILAKNCLEPSDNIYAEHLMLLAATQSSPLGDDPYGEAGVRFKKFLVDKVGLSPGDVRPVDGSGLSRQNLVTAYALAKALHWADQQPFAADFRTALAAPGEGTLRTRLKDSQFAGKTGTINAVSTLSGIIRPGGSSSRYMSICFNGALVSGTRLRQVQDEFVRAIENKDPDNADPEMAPDL